MILHKLKGRLMPLPPAPPLKHIACAGLGGFLAIALLAALTEYSASPLLLGSFGASCVLIFGFPDVPFSQPRNIFFGHGLSSLIGLATLALCGPHGWAVALAVGLSMAAMMLTRTVHPPAGSNPVIVFLLQPGWGFLAFPTLAGALLLVIVALLYNNLRSSRGYPGYW